MNEWDKQENEESYTMKRLKWMDSFSECLKLGQKGQIPEKLKEQSLKDWKAVCDDIDRRYEERKK